MPDTPPSESGSRKSGKSKSSSSEGKKHSWWKPWQRWTNTPTGGKRKETSDNESEKKRPRSGPGQHVVGPQSGIERKDTRTRPPKPSLSGPPRTRQEHYPQNAVTSLSAHPDSREYYAESINAAEQYKPGGSHYNADEVGEYSLSAPAFAPRPNEETQRSSGTLYQDSGSPHPAMHRSGQELGAQPCLQRGELEERSGPPKRPVVPDRTVPQYIASPGIQRDVEYHEPQYITPTSAQGGADHRLGSSIGGNRAQGSEDYLNTPNDDVTTLTARPRHNSEGTYRPRTLEGSAGPPLSPNTRAASATPSENTLHGQDRLRIDCPFGACGHIIPEFADKCHGYMGAIDGSAYLTQHILTEHPLYCHTCYECFPSRGVKKVNAKLKEHVRVCQGPGPPKPAECLWRSQVAQERFLALNKKSWAGPRWVKSVKIIAPGLTEDQIPPMYKPRPTSYYPRQVASPAMSQYPVPAVDSMLAARQTQAPEHAPQDASIDATFAEQPGRAAEVADSSTSLPSQLLSGSELSQASHEVDPLWRGDENLFGDENFNFGHQSAQNQDPIDPCLHGFDETIFANMLTNATRGNEAGISTATTQDSSGGASQYTEHLRPENALLTAEVDERINETSNKIEDFRHLLQAELSDRVRDFEDLMGAVQFEIELQATSPFMHPRFKSWMNTEQKVKDFEIVLQTNCPDLLPDFRRLIRSVQKGKSRA